MGTIVSAGSGDGVVVATGARTEFGGIAVGLGDRHTETEFQVGLRGFSRLLVQVAAVLSVSIFVINLVLQRPAIDALLFSLAIAVGITPQLLPAVVTTSLATGSRRLARLKVLVKRLVCIEDLGDIDILFTDKTGTLTEGKITFNRGIDADGATSTRVVELGLVCSDVTVDGGEAVGGNPLDLALWIAPSIDPLPIAAYRSLATLPFDHTRQRSSVLVARGTAGEALLVTKGAPESVLACCSHLPEGAVARLDELFASGARVVAVASRARLRRAPRSPPPTSRASRSTASSCSTIDRRQTRPSPSPAWRASASR